MKYETENIIMSIIFMILLAVMGISEVFMIINNFKFISSSNDLFKEIVEILMFLMMVITIIVYEVGIIKDVLLENINSLKNNKEK